MKKKYYSVDEAIKRKLHGYMFEPNDPKVRKRIRYNLANFLKRLKEEKKVVGFFVLCDETNNSKIDIDVEKCINVDVEITDLKNIKNKKRYIVHPTSKSLN